MSDTSVNLLDRLCRQGDAAAWGRFVELYAPLVHRWAVRAGLQSADAADLVQDVFITVYRELPHFKYDPQRSFRAWLKAVTLNLWRTKQRRAAALPLRDTEELPVADPAAAVWEQEYRAWLVARALKVMQTDFDPHVWQACWLTVVEGQAAEVVARQLGMSIGAVYAARCRVLARLREELAGLDL
ncbi:MAG: sigma-70 family RNA polymerase sigma factor [Gemmataceae bacterium]|nr:sigma-70 family RNA polymerase sigma factor [Gemmataceae bacterium]MDW8242667.1 sigma-70 family RNA polymerase sigma factor [Thermogemmata sp.]